MPYPRPIRSSRIPGRTRLAALVLASSLIASLAAVVPFQPAAAAGPFTVNTTADTHDANTGDGVCSDGSACSLRAALEQANASGGSTTINLPPGTYNLSLGDLIAGTQANTAITLHGTGAAASTIIHQAGSGLMDIVVNYNVDANVVLSLDNLTLTGGSENENDPDGFGGNGGAILAGGSSSAAGNSLTVTNVTFSGDYCSPVSNAGCTGGAISMTGGGDLTVTGSTFSGNSASKNSGTGGGGAIYFDNGGQPGNVSITASTFTNNTARAGQGGAVFLAGGVGTTYTLTNDTFTANSSGGSGTTYGGAVYLSQGSLTARFDRIVGNTSTTGSGLFVANNTGSIGTATDDWWGCDGGPGATGCDSAVLGGGSGGSLSASPYIVLKTSASPSPINYGETTLLTASFLQDSSNTGLTTAQISTLIGLPVAWSNTSHGALSSTQTTIQSNGTATASFTAGSTSADCVSNAGSEAKVDNVQNGDSTATAVVSIRCPDLTVIKTDDVGGTATFPSGWTWTLTAANSGAGYAAYSNGQTILSDNLPSTGAAYGSLTTPPATGVTGTIACAISLADDLTCSASGAVQIAAAGHFAVSFAVTPAAGGAFANPRLAGVCAVDPNNNVPETSDANNTCSDSVTVGQPPSITSADHVTFTAGSAGNFGVTAVVGYPGPLTLAASGTLPSGVTFSDNGDGTATLAGTPAAGTGGVYPLTLSAHNGTPPDASQPFTLTVDEAASITSANHASFPIGSPGTFTVTAHGYPLVGLAESGALPSGVTFTDNGDNTATLTGTPASGSNGSYPLTFTASNGAGPDATQSFSLIVSQAPSITSADHASFQAGSAGTFAVTTTGDPAPALSESGALPSGVTFLDHGDGSGTLGGTPASGSGGSYPLSLTASNGVGPDATQTFTLTVDQDLAFTSASAATFSTGSAGSFTVTVTGFPTATLSESGVLPSGVTFTDNGDNSATLSGTPASGSGGSYPLALSAHNGVSADATQAFTLTVQAAPALTSAAAAIFLAGQANSFSVTATGFPLDSLSESGALPAGVTFVDNGNNTAALAGTPGAGTEGSYPLTLSAHNGAGPDASQSFSLTVEDVPVVTKVNSVADTGDGQVDENEHTNIAITQLLVVFANPMNAAQAATASNYGLVENGSTVISIDSIAYSSLTQTATLSVNGGVKLPDGTYRLTVKAGLQDSNGIGLPADFVRNFAVDTTAPLIVTDGVDGQPGSVIVHDSDSYTAHFTSLAVSFDKDVQNPSGDSGSDDVTNPANYLLLKPGPNGIFDTLSCAAGVAGDDLPVPTGPVTYDNHGGSGPFVATLGVNNGTPLPDGTYRLLVCGTTSIRDLAGNALNGGSDSLLTFTLTTASSGGGGGGATTGGVLIPVTGFAPGQVTALAPQDVAYSDLGDLWVEIPRLGVRMPIMGVPQSHGTWDVSWLGNDAGWLAGSAFPGWSGNSVLTGHVWNADNTPGPFLSIGTLGWNDQVIVHAYGSQYVYAVRSVTQVAPDDAAAMMQHEDQPWLTLVTCRGYDAVSSTYRYRVLVRAVLIAVK